jgi:acyl-CoA synthetase (AMP-forming)/AMP-acid ligase II
VPAAITALPRAASVLTRAGLIRPERPDRLLRAGLAMRRWGLTPAAGYAAAAARFPDATGLIDERGELTFAEIHGRSNALAHALLQRGIGEGSLVGMLCRNHRWFVEASVALAKAGADVIYLNPGSAGPQLAEIIEREGVTGLIYDQELGPPDLELRDGQLLAWHDGAAPDDSLEALIADRPRIPPPSPRRESKVVMLTSGTTGTPKGARPGQPKSLMPAVAMLARIPLRARETTLVAPPLFHAWGFGLFRLGQVLSSTQVIHRRFNPEAALAAIERHRVTAIVAVPAMLQRLLELPADVRSGYELSSLRVVMVGSAPLSAELVTRFMDVFGDVLYNFYGSTEFAWATIATPDELRAAPGTAGRPPLGTAIRILDESGHEMPPGEIGRVYVGNEMLFEGYTSSDENREIVDGMMRTGDVGRIDDNGLLFLEGRDDEMIISGGENVYPQEVEQTISGHPHVAEAAVIGVEDERFGQRLRAFVVPSEGSSVSRDEIRSYVKAKLADYKAPRDVVFVGELPRTVTGKLIRHNLDQLEDAS